MKTIKDLTGIAVQSQGGEHGKEVIKTFNKLGINTSRFRGELKGDFYGLSRSNVFVATSYKEEYFTKIITLEELKSYLKTELPRVVWAWDDDKEDGFERVMKEYDENCEKPVVCYYGCERIEDIKKGEMEIWFFKHFCELSDYKPTLTYNGKEVTKDEMLKLLGREV